MRRPREVLESIEATLEGGKEPTGALFVELGMPATQDPIESEPRPGWDAGEVALFHYVRGMVCLARATSAASDPARRASDDATATARDPAAGARAFVDAFGGLVAAKDAARSTRAVARALRLWARSSSELSDVLDASRVMIDQLAWMRANAPRRDVEELELSLAEMFTRLVRAGGTTAGDAVARVFALVRPTLARLFEQLLTRQRSVPYAIAAYWLAVPELWADSDLDAPREWFGAIGGGRGELRRAALTRACELEDGSTYRVGVAPPVQVRKGATLEQLQRELEVARAEAERERGGARGATTKPDTGSAKAEPVRVVEPVAASAEAVTVAAVEPFAVEPVAVEPVAVEPVAVEPAVEPVAVEPAVDPVASIEPGQESPAPKKKGAAVKKPAAKKTAPKDPAAGPAKPAKKSATKTKR